MDPFAELWGPPKTTGAGPLTMQLIKGLEGYAPVAKWDVRQHSGGYGSRAAPGERFTPELAEQRLTQDVAPVNSWLDKNVTQPLSPERRAAFNSFGYNLGVDDLERLKPDINRGDWQTVGNRMLSFNKALNEKTGQLEPLSGLTNRRRQEAAMVTGGQMPESNMQQQADFMQRRPGSMQPGPLTSAMGGMSNSMVPGIFGGGDGPGYFGKLLSDPTFLTGASVLGGGLAGQDFGTALSRGAQGASAQSEMFDKRRKAAAWQKIFAGGQPDMNSPMLKGVPPDVVPLIQQMGPEEGMKALTQLAFKRMAPRQLTPVSPGSSLYDEQAGKEVFRAPAADKFPAGFQAAPDGNGLAFIPGGPADPALKVKEVQYSEGASKAANFGNMMAEAETALTGMAPKGPDGKPILGPDGKPLPLENPLGAGGTLKESMLPEGAANAVRSPEYQNYRQAAMQWVRAKLRKESGAAISPSEFEGEFQTYFPQYGDDPGVRMQKQRAREQAQLGMIAESRGAYEQLFGQRKPQQQGGLVPPPGPGNSPPAPQAGPQPGAVEEGYRFKGGNPADPNSWERIQ
jgi:GH24 family phage-related lysozyme (muramidase)